MLNTIWFTLFVTLEIINIIATYINAIPILSKNLIPLISDLNAFAASGFNFLNSLTINLLSSDSLWAINKSSTTNNHFK